MAKFRFYIYKPSISFTSLAFLMIFSFSLQPVQGVTLNIFPRTSKFVLLSKPHLSVFAEFIANFSCVCLN